MLHIYTQHFYHQAKTTAKIAPRLLTPTTFNEVFNSIAFESDGISECIVSI